MGWDSTRKKGAECEKSEEKYKNLAESPNKLIYCADPNTFAATFVNKSIEKNYGYTVKEWLNDPTLREKTVHPDDKGRVTLEIRESKKNDLKISEECLRLNIKKIPIAGMVWDMEWNVLEWNNSAERMFGYNCDEIIGKNVLECIVPKESRSLVAPLMEDFRRGKSSNYSEINNNIRKDGSLISCQWNNIPLLDNSGKTFAVLSMVEDVTERKKVEEELKEQTKEARFLAKMISSSQQPSYVGLSDGTLLKVNPAFCKLTGYTEKELLDNVTWNETLTPKKWREFEEEKLVGSLKTKKPVRFEKEYIKKDGSIIPIELFAQPFYDSEENLEYLHSFITDISERKKIEGELRINKNHLSLVLNNTSDSISLIKIEPNDCHRIILVNKAFLLGTGFKDDQVIGKLIDEILPESEFRFLLAQHKKAISSGKMISFDRAIDLLSERKSYRTRLFPIFNEKQECTFVIGIATDITEQKKAEEKIKNLQKKLMGKLERDKKILSEKVTKLTKKIPLTQNEKLVFYSLVKYPLFNDQQLANKLKIKRSTITAIKNKLLRQGFYSTYIVPNFELIDCELMCILNGKMPNNRRKNMHVFKKVMASPEVIYNINTDKEFLSIIVSKKFTETKKLIDDILIMYEKQNIEKPEVAYFPYAMSNVINLFDYSSLIKSLFNLNIKDEVGDLIKPIKRKLTNNEKIILYTLTKYPNLTDLEIASKAKISRPTISLIRKNLIKERFLIIINIPDVKKLNCELIIYSNVKMKNEKNLTISPSVFMIDSRRESGNIFVFENYTKYREERHRLKNFFEKEELIKRIFSVGQIKFKKIDFSSLVKKIFELKVDF